LVNCSDDADARHKAGHDEERTHGGMSVGQWTTWQMKPENNRSFTIG
jgi:hypothetical protein